MSVNFRGGLHSLAKVIYVQRFGPACVSHKRQIDTVKAVHGCVLHGITTAAHHQATRFLQKIQELAKLNNWIRLLLYRQCFITVTLFQ